MFGRVVLAVGAAAVFGMVSVVAVVVSSNPAAGPPSSGSALADRVNAACGKYELADWTTGDDFDPLPPGLIQVTCSRRDGTLFTVAVAR